MKRRVAVLGSTGATGKQALEVMSKHNDVFSVEVLTTDNKVGEIVEQAKTFHPNTIIVTEKEAFEKVKSTLSGTDIKIFVGEESLQDVVTWDIVDLILIATIGFSGLRPTLNALEAGKAVAIANKEILAAAGKIIREKALENKAILIPVNRTLSSVFQSLIGEDTVNIDKITLTASGGPFLGRKHNFLVNVKKEHALYQVETSEPLDEKTGVDTATLMNKGLEMIAAKWLFHLNNDQLDVMIHPESVVQSTVQLKNGAMKAFIGLPDDRISLLFALAFPNKIHNSFPTFSFKDYHRLTFDKPDEKTFLNLKMAKEAMAKGHNVPCILNAANEVVVQSFLNNKIGFMEMSSMIEECLAKIPIIENPTIEDLEKTDSETRKLAESLAKNSQFLY